jgi:5'-nucleotidase / UDP-sugar diphosphatase
MRKAIRKIIFILMLFCMIIPSSALAQPVAGSIAPVSVRSLGPDAVATITILHTNDVHGNMEPVEAAPPTGSPYPGLARLAKTIKDNSVAGSTLIFDGGDIMQGSLLSNINKGEPTIDVFNFIGYDASTFGNHEFDWGQTVLAARSTQAAFPMVSSNIVVSDTGSCATAGWTVPAFVDAPWITITVGTSVSVTIGILGVTTQETPNITLANNTKDLCFKDPADSILHYFDAVKAQSDAVIVLSHLGLEDGGYGYGFAVYGDKSLAIKLATAGKKPDTIIGGHSHTNMSAAFIQNGITIAQARSGTRNVGKAVFTIDAATHTVTNITWTRLLPDVTSLDTPATPYPYPDALADTPTETLIHSWVMNPAYQALIKQVIGYTNVPLLTNYNGDGMMAEFIDDSLLYQLNSDGTPDNDSDMFFNNAGGIRADITASSYPYTLTYGSMFSVLPFGNQTVVGDLTGARVLELLNQSATLEKGALQPAGIRYTFYRYSDALPAPAVQPFAWDAYDVTVRNRTTGFWEPLDLNKTYRVATNEFLAPAGGDSYAGFKYMTNISYWGDMLNQVNTYVTTTYGTPATAYNGPYGNGLLDGRILRNGSDTMGSGTIIPITILHHNDSHGNALKGSYVGYTQLATLIKQERAHNPTRTLLLNGGDTIQGDAMMYYFKSAGLGYAADGTEIITPTMHINPLIAAMNTMNYTAMTLGNHEFNFGHEIFTSTIGLATFPVLQANLYDDGRYGIAQANVKPSINVTVPGYGNGPVKIAILGIGNHRVPNYELPSNIPGLTFTNPISETLTRAPALHATNDVVVALTHIGFTTNPKSVEVDNNVDTNLAAQTTGVDVIIGSHSHTNPASPETPYKYLPTFVSNPSNQPVLINQAYRYNNTLGEVVLGVIQKSSGGYQVVTRAGRDISVGLTIAEDATIKALLAPYNDMLAAYNNQVLGQTTTPIDALQAFTQETTGANLQADAAMYELNTHGIFPDFHISGAMTNKAVAGSGPYPYTLKISDMFTIMPYENSLVVLNMNGPQLKAVLERGYRNYYYYKYVSGVGGYSYYTTCMLDINAMNNVAYHDTYPALPDGTNVDSLFIHGKKIDFNDANTYYKVSTVNYLAAGSCNFNDAGVSLWPLNQIYADTQYYVRDAVIHYISYKGTVGPKIEKRLAFRPIDLTLVQSQDVSTWNAVDGTLGGGWSLPLYSWVPWQYLDAQNLPVNTKQLAETVHPFFVNTYPAGFFEYWAGRNVCETCTGTWEPMMWEIINGRQPIFYLQVNPDGGGGQTYRLLDGLTRLLGGGDVNLRIDGTYHLGQYTYVGSVTDKSAVNYPMFVAIKFNAQQTIWFLPLLMK